MPTVIRPKTLIVYRRNEKYLAYSMEVEEKADISEFGEQLNGYNFITIHYKGDNGVTEDLIFKEDIKNIQLIYEEKQC